MSKLLLVDDDSELRSLLKDILELEGFTVIEAINGLQGLAQLSEDIDLILLDVMMPQMNGIDMLTQLRQKRQTPVLMLTAKGDDIDRIIGLELGADDYLAKPFNDRELLARIRAILRRTANPAHLDDSNSSSEEKLKVIHQDNLMLYPETQEAYYSDLSISESPILVDLTGTEFLLLSYLMARAGNIISKSELSETIFGKKLQPFDRSIDVHLSNIRKKIPEKEGQKARIKTIRGRGYLYTKE